MEGTKVVLLRRPDKLICLDVREGLDVVKYPNQVHIPSCKKQKETIIII